MTVPLPEPISTMIAKDITFGDTPSLEESRRITIAGMPVVTLDQCQAYGDARVREALEAALALVDQMGSKPVSCADAIRRLMP